MTIVDLLLESRKGHGQHEATAQHIMLLDDSSTRSKFWTRSMGSFPAPQTRTCNVCSVALCCEKWNAKAMIQMIWRCPTVERACLSNCTTLGLFAELARRIVNSILGVFRQEERIYRISDGQCQITTKKS